MEITTGFIALVDALGVSTLDNEQALEFIKKRDVAIAAAKKAVSVEGVRETLEQHGLDWTEWENAVPPITLTIGDTIVFVWRDNALGAKLVDFVLMFLDTFLVNSFHVGILFRGALTYGDFVFDGSTTVIGNAVARASTFHEGHDVPSVIAGQEVCRLIEPRLVELQVENGDNPGVRGFVRKRSVNFKTCKKGVRVWEERETYVISWLTGLRLAPLELLEKLNFHSIEEYFERGLADMKIEVDAPEKYAEARRLFAESTNIHVLP